MTIELVVPSLGESITEVYIGSWRKQVGQRVAKDENLVEIESDKATVELPSPADGVLTQVLKKHGQTAAVGEVIGYVDPQAAPGEAPAPGGAPPSAQTVTAPGQRQDTGAAAAPVTAGGQAPRVMPAARRELAQAGLSPAQVTPSGPGGRLLKEDVRRAVEAAPDAHRRPASGEARPQPVPTEPAESEVSEAAVSAASRVGAEAEAAAGAAADRQEETVPMSPIRRRIAQRLVEAQQTAALLTTFNEIDMSAVIALRNEHRETFQKRYGIKLGFMSMFVKASIEALKQFPAVNAEIRGTDIVYRNYYDIGIAVAGGKGLVVPVIRSAERLSFAEIESEIDRLARLARENKLLLEQLQGGTFTITNGGIFGSLLSTPIINPPQSGILGLHAIQERPVAAGGQVVIRPMMYVALTYDHRIVDGREAVTFLRRIKEVVEEPVRMLLEI